MTTTWTRNADGDWIARIPGSSLPVVLVRVWGGWVGWRGRTRSLTQAQPALALHDLAEMARSPRLAEHLRRLPLPPVPPEVIVYRRGGEWSADLSVLRDGVSRVVRCASGDSSAQAVGRLAASPLGASVRAAINTLPGIGLDSGRWRVLTDGPGPACWVAELEVTS